MQQMAMKGSQTNRLVNKKKTKSCVKDKHLKATESNLLLVNFQLSFLKPPNNTLTNVSFYTSFLLFSHIS